MTHLLAWRSSCKGRQTTMRLLHCQQQQQRQALFLLQKESLTSLPVAAAASHFTTTSRHDAMTTTTTTTPTALSMSLLPATTKNCPLVHATTGRPVSSSLGLLSSWRRYKSSAALSDNNQDDGDDHHHDGSNDNIIPFLLADIGEGIKEVELLQWYVQVGDTVQEFDTICQVQSDKATVDITSRYAGKVTQLGAQVGDFCQVGAPLLFLQPPKGSSSAPTSSSSSSSRAAESSRHALAGEDSTTTTTSSSNSTTTNTTTLADQMAADAAQSYQDERLRIPTMATHYTLPDDNDNKNGAHKILTSPAVRKLAAEHAIDLGLLRGTGPQGRILKADVLQYIGQQQQGFGAGASVTAPPSPAAPPLAPSSPTTTTTPTLSPRSPLTQESSEIVQLKGYSRFMVQTMTQALQIPHMTLGDEVVLDQVLKLRRQWKDSHDGVAAPNNISVLAFMLKACSLALREFPLLNASIYDLEACQLQVHAHHHLGVAMDTPRGLVVPAVQFVEQKSLAEIQADLDGLKEQAKSSAGVDSSVLNATFTLSNIGALGVGKTMSAVLAPPQVAMGAVGRMQRVPRFVSDDDSSLQVQAVQVANVSWTADHRVLDGATLARFHQRFAGYLQDPTSMLLHCK